MNKTSPWGRRMARLSSLLVLPIGLAMLALAVVYLGVQELSRARIQPASEVVTPEQFARAERQAEKLRADLLDVKNGLKQLSEKVGDPKSAADGEVAKQLADLEKKAKDAAKEVETARADAKSAKTAVAGLAEWKKKTDETVATKADKGKSSGTTTVPVALTDEQIAKAVAPAATAAARKELEMLTDRVTKAEAAAKSAAEAARTSVKPADVDAKLKDAVAGATKDAVKSDALKPIREKLEELATGLNGEKAKREDIEKKLSAMPRAEATDVAVLAMHSRTLGIHNYYDGAIQDFVDPKKTTPPAGSRLGFYLAEGSDFEPIFPLSGKGADEGAKKMAKLDKARGAASARLVAAQVKSLKGEFTDAKKARCVLIGSTECGLDDAALTLAKEVPTHVVLIGREGDEGAAAEKGLKEWHRLAREQGLPLTILRCDRPEDPDDKTKAQLRAALDLATRPKFTTPKR